MVEAEKNGHPGRRAETAELPPELLRTLVHELRNPLSPIRNAAELLRTLSTDPRQLQSIEIISRQVSILTRALDELSHAVEATQGQLLLNGQEVDVSEIIEPALQAIRPAVDQRRQNLVVTLPGDPIEMYCDPPRLTQVVQTLLQNATGHTPDGGSIALHVSTNATELVIDVRDDGAGISQEKLRSLFNVFAERSPSAAWPSATSTAQPPLNLAISRNIVEMHRGTIEAYSDGLGRGSRFVARLPLVEASNATASLQASTQPFTRADVRKVIVIDDHLDSASSLRDVLAAAGHSVLVATTGEAGIALAETFAPDAVIVDIGLPGMDGFEVARQLRANEATAQAVLIAVSGFSLKQFRELSAYSVFRHYLLKPASPETILAIVESDFERATQRRR